jgi:3-ketosteroid 9alpha-monooxygenase subunit A
MRVPFTWRPTGWFMVGWGAEIPPGTTKPLKYFGQDLVAYRTHEGDLHLLDAHCLHLGAHLGHHGTVNGDCIECPYHGWGWGPDGENKYIPYEDRPNTSKHLRAWPVEERHECIFVWHDPAGGPPRWEIPDLFGFPDHMPVKENDFYRCYPEVSVRYEREPVHPQISLENGPDTIHFKYVHNATVDPVLVDWHFEDQIYFKQGAWPIPTEDGGERLGLKNHARMCGVGGSFSVFEGRFPYRLAFWTTPVDNETSDLFYSVWWPRDEGDDSEVIPDRHRERTQVHLQALWDDLEIWRYQVYVENPALAQQDARPYGQLRKWARQFYEVPPDES